jgi:predicted HicB family RNase H-like nuclease
MKASDKMTAKYPTLTIRLPQETLNALRIEAQQHECSVAEIVKNAIALYYNNQYDRTTTH